MMAANTTIKEQTASYITSSLLFSVKKFALFQAVPQKNYACQQFDCLRKALSDTMNKKEIGYEKITHF